MREGVFVVLAALIVTGCEAKDRVRWEAYSPEKMIDARRSGRPTIAYFYAAWCPPCYKLKERTFSDPRVISALKAFVRIKVDMSYRRSPRTQEIGRRFGIGSVPAILFYDPDGNRVQELEIRGFVSADELLQVIEIFQSRFPILRTFVE